MKVAELRFIPSVKKTGMLLNQLGDLIPYAAKISVTEKAIGLNKMKEIPAYKAYGKILDAICELDNIPDADVPEVGPAYREMSKLLNVFGEMEIG